MATTTAQQLFAEANYLEKLAPGQRPFTYTHDPGDGRQLQFYPIDTRTVPIEDVRETWDLLHNGEEQGKRKAPKLMEEGTELVLDAHGLAEGLKSEDFDDLEKIKEVYHPKLLQFLKERIEEGGKRRLKRAIIFDTTVRRRNGLQVSVAEAAKSGSIRGPVAQPVGRIHGDYTEFSGNRRVRDHIGGEEAEKLIAENRFAIINVWRPLEGPILDAPLAFLSPGAADPTTDFIPHDLIYPHLKGETLAVTYNPSHKLIYASSQLPHEAWVFKTYDSKKKLGGIQVHSGIDEPNPEVFKKIRPGSKGRQSVENRILVFWDDVETVAKI